MVTSSETWSEEARAGADILDLDRYMRGSRPARRAAPAPRDLSSSGLVVDAGAAGAGAGAGAGRGSSSASSASEPSDKRFSHDSGLSDTTYRHQRAVRHKRVISSSGTETAERRRGNKSGSEAKERRRSKTSGGEPTERRGKKNGGEAARRGSSDSINRKFRESLERALRDQQAQIARVAALCERQAQAQARSERSERHKERSRKPGERRRPGSGAGATRSSSGTSDLSSSNSSLDPHKRPSTECRTYKIIMSKLDELNRLFAARRAAPAAALAPAPAPAPARTRTRTRLASSGSVTVSDKVVGTDSRHHTTRQAKARPSVVAAGAIDIPPRHNVVTESVVRGEERGASSPPSDKGMPGRFHLDDPVRLYQQAKRLDAARAQRRGSASGSSRGSAGSHGSARGSAGSHGSARCSAGSHGSARGSAGSHGSARGSPSLCALCRCYWSVARRYVAAQFTAVRE